MGYKFLGFLVWQGVKLWLRRSPVPTNRKVLGGAAALAIGAVAAAVAGSRGDRTQL
jgi:hypothetical protein